jgi:CheY-like chemotaxis protein
MHGQLDVTSSQGQGCGIATGADGHIVKRTFEQHLLLDTIARLKECLMKPRVLLVENSPTQELRFKFELAHRGLKVEVARDGATGLAAARSQPPDAIVLDVDLPELDGYDLCRVLKADPATAHIPIVMLTRWDEAHAALAVLDAGAADCIPKDSFAEHNLVQALQLLGLI